MANGGIIGPVNDPVEINVTACTQFFTSSGNFTATKSQNVDYLVMAGGGGGGHQVQGAPTHHRRVRLQRHMHRRPDQEAQLHLRRRRGDPDGSSGNQHTQDQVPLLSASANLV